MFEGRPKVAQQPFAVVEALRHGREAVVEGGGRRTVDGDIRAHLGIFQKGAAGGKVVGGAADLPCHLVRPARGGEHGAVRQLMPARMGAPQPVFVHLAALGDGQPGIHIAVALRARPVGGEEGAVPARLRFRTPEGALLQGAQVVVEECRIGQLFGALVVVDLHHVEGGIHLFVAELEGDHHVGADGRIGIGADGLRLLADVGDDGLILEAYPLDKQRGVVPGIVAGRDDVGKGAVCQAPTPRAPASVQYFDGPILLFEIGLEARGAQGAEAAVVVMEDLVVQLPADDGGMPAQRLRQLLGDDAVFFAHDGAGLADVAAAAELGALAV